MSDLQGIDVEKIAREIGVLVAHPQYQALIEELERTPEHERVEAARRLATRDELTRRGIPLPEGFRITLRWFEDHDARWPLKEATEQTPVPVQAAWTICGSIGFIVCASAGREFEF
jgi:hypothetical protein